MCGRSELVVIESRNVRRLRDRLSTAWDPRVRVTEFCNHCGARMVVAERAIASVS